MLKAIPAIEFSAKPRADKWSKQEVLGHLIDSARVNHNRFLMLQAGDIAAAGYWQDQLVIANNYQGADATNLIALWESYNRHLLHVVQSIPADCLANRYGSGPEALSFKELIDDYIVHMQHHLQQILVIQFD